MHDNESRLFQRFTDFFLAIGRVFVNVEAGQQYLEDMCFEDVVAQLDCLLPVQLVLLPREPEGQQGVAAPVNAQPEQTLSRLSQEKAYLRVGIYSMTHFLRGGGNKIKSEP